MRDLCIDTSVGANVAVVTDEGVYAVREANPRAHAERLAVLIERALTEAGLSPHAGTAGLDQVIVGTGPATFTGLRAGLITARVIATVAGVPLRGIPSLDILARNYLDGLAPDDEVVVVTDARRKEVYWARYRPLGPNDVECVEGPHVATPDSVANRFRDDELIFAGPACQLYPDALPTSQSTMDVQVDIASRIVRARLLSGGTEFSTEPLYLRRPDIHPGKGAR
ncbi:MAG: tRNA (adenosine(37)-N6)-threonylcarbamoyltransferase complex dimerization subunit type 1 TsaB [Actinomycetaceae bacterium]|nr:tRNA (adenosine(37)-N6)-threonylcarbamoyltransferase complex dimerization subunit type 1 TsaB [Actinomycetaceae bacterium]